MNSNPKRGAREIYTTDQRGTIVMTRNLDGAPKPTPVSVVVEKVIHQSKSLVVNWAGITLTVQMKDFTPDHKS